jgi:hypothetical protein
MPGHLEPQQLSPTVPLNQEGKQEIKAQRRHNAHIDGGDRLSVSITTGTRIQDFYLDALEDNQLLRECEERLRTS